MSNNTVTCRTLFEKMHLLSDTAISVLLSTNIMVAIVNVVVNLVLIALMVATKQYKNMSLRLTMYMSFSDLFVGLVSQHMMTYFLLNARSEINCELQVVLQYVLYLFPHITGFFVGIVALDRYMRVKFTNKYSELMTVKRQTISVVIVVILAMLNCLILISGIFTGNWIVALLGIQPLDSTFLTCDILLYWRSIVLMREHMKANGIDLKHFNRSISKLATIYLVLVIIFYPPYLTLDFVQVFINSNDTTVIFFHVLTLIWVFLNSGVNGISFVIVNRKAQRKLHEWRISLFRKTARVTPTQRYSQDGKSTDQ